MSIEYLIGNIFHPSGEPDSLQSLGCHPLAVVRYSFVGRGFAFAALSACEYSVLMWTDS
jgi:hypothetical protein